MKQPHEHSSGRDAEDSTRVRIRIYGVQSLGLMHFKSTSHCAESSFVCDDRHSPVVSLNRASLSVDEKTTLYVSNCCNVTRSHGQPITRGTCQCVAEEETVFLLQRSNFVEDGTRVRHPISVSSKGIRPFWLTKQASVSYTSKVEDALDGLRRLRPCAA